MSRKYNREELFGFFVANFLYNSATWVGDLLQDDADQLYKKWLKTQQSLTYVFKQDIDRMFDLVEMPEEMLKVVDGQYPLLYNEHLQGKISVETIIILNDILNFFPMWDKKLTDTIRWPDYRRKCEKYAAFLPQDVVKFKLILKKVLL